MKSDEPETDKTVSINQIQPLISRKLPRLVTSIPGKKSQNESDNDGVAKATITHSESGTGDRKKGRKLVSELTKMGVKRSKGKDRKRKMVLGPSVDTSRARGSSDVVRLAVRELGWREVCLCLLLLSRLRMKNLFCPDELAEAEDLWRKNIDGSKQMLIQELFYFELTQETVVLIWNVRSRIIKHQVLKCDRCRI